MTGKIFMTSKKILSGLILSLLITTAIISGNALASKVDVHVSGIMTSDFKVTKIEETNNVIALYVGVHNTGSFIYDTTARMDIMDGNIILATGWSKTEIINPGNRKGLVVYGYKPDSNNISVRARLHYGNEITEQPLTPINERVDAEYEPAFSVYNLRTYDNFIRFDLETNQTLDNILILPQGFPATWKISQEKIDHMESGTIKQVVLPYQTNVFKERDISILVVTEDGLHLNEYVFKLKKETGFMKYINIFVDLLGGLFRS